MPLDQLPTRLPQPLLLELEESTGNIELFPALWSAVEEFIGCVGEFCHGPLDELMQLNAPRFSPVVAYLLATRLTDPDLQIRTRITQIIADVLAPDSNGNPAPQPVRNSLSLFLTQIRTRQVYALLQVCSARRTMEESVARILNLCPYAGNHLVDILGDHRTPMPIRSQAARMIGLVGYLDALGGLEKYAGKIEARSNGQKEMGFSSTPVTNDSELLESIQQAIYLLRAP